MCQPRSPSLSKGGGNHESSLTNFPTTRVIEVDAGIDN